MNQVYVALREGNGDACGGESIVDSLLCTVKVGDALGYQHHLLHIDVYSAIAHIAHHHIEAVVGIHYLFT